MCRLSHRLESLDAPYGPREGSADRKLPNQFLALGPELVPWAREYTNDLNEAHFLVHQVLAQLSRRLSADGEPLNITRAPN